MLWLDTESTLQSESVSVEGNNEEGVEFGRLEGAVEFGRLEGAVEFGGEISRKTVVLLWKKASASSEVILDLDVVIVTLVLVYKDVLSLQ